MVGNEGYRRHFALARVCCIGFLQSGLSSAPAGMEGRKTPSPRSFPHQAYG